MQRSPGGRAGEAAGSTTGRSSGTTVGGAGLLLKTLGRLELQPAALTRPKPLLLLAYLALEGGTHRRELVELFFANAADPRDSLSTTLRRLGRIPGAVDLKGPQVATPVTCDAVEVLHQLDCGVLAAACAAYEGPFLAGAAPPLPAGGEEWIFSVREYMSKRILDACLLLGAVALQDGDLAAARRHAAAAYAQYEKNMPDPAVVGRLYHLLKRTGHPEADSVLGLVRDVIGVQSTDEEPNSLLPSLGPPPPGQLISREAEYDAVIGTITTREARLITIHGPGGVGKTRLAQELIHAPPLAMAFGAARLFVPLEAVPDPELVPAAVAAQMGLELPPSGDQWAALAHSIGARDQLLMLDGWEHLREASSSLVRLLPYCPGLIVVVTSRETLRVPAEWVVTLASLEAPAVDADPEAIRANPAFRLFVQQARRHNLTFNLTDAELATAGRICRAVDGLPLALALAGAWTHGMSLVEIAEILEEDPTTLAANNMAVGARHSSLRRVLDAAWSRLEPRQRQVLKRLSVHRGGFRRDAASAVAGANMADLVGLLDLSWLTSRADGRFEQHAVLRHYAGSQLDLTPKSAREAHEAHSRHYLQPLLEATNGQDTAIAPALIPRLLEEEGNVLACLERSVERQDAAALTVLAQALQWYFAVRGRFRDADALFQRAINMLPPDEPALKEPLSLLLSGRAWCGRFIGNIDETLVLARKSLVLAEECESTVARYAALDALGQGQMLRGENPSATESFRVALALARELGDDARACRVMEKLVYTHVAVGDLEEATGISELALQLVSSGAVPPSLDAVVTYMAAGFLSIAKRDWRGAAQMMGSGLALTNSIDHPGPAALLEAALGLAEVAGGLEDVDPTRLASGTAHAATALAMARSRDEVLPLAFASSTLGRVAAHEGRFTDAQAHLREGIEAAWAKGNRTAALWASPWQVELYYLQGDLSAAAEFAEALAREPGTPAWIRGWLQELGAFKGQAVDGAASLDVLVERMFQEQP